MGKYWIAEKVASSPLELNDVVDAVKTVLKKVLLVICLLGVPSIVVNSVDVLVNFHRKSGVQPKVGV